MIVLNEIEYNINRANNCYIELSKRYIGQVRVGNDIRDIFAKLNIIKSCIRTLQVFNLNKPQLIESDFNYIIDIINGIYVQLFTINVKTYIPNINSNVDNGCSTAGVDVDWLYFTFQPTEVDQVQFPILPFNVSQVDVEGLRLVINGESKLYGVMNDYHIVNSTLYWHDDTLHLDPQDHITLAYYLR